MTFGSLGRLPYNTVSESVRHPLSAAREALGTLGLRHRLSAFTGVSTRTLDAWTRVLVERHRFHKRLSERWADLGERRADLRSVGGGTGLYNEVLYLLIRSFQPARVVETGVAYGFSSAYILRALEDNGEGTLYSIDRPNAAVGGYRNADGQLDSVYLGSLSQLGAIVPPELRGRWHVKVGTSRDQLPDLLESIGTIDAFFHDSDHSATNMAWEFQEAWSHLRAKGVLIADDVSSNSVFDDFVARTAQPSLRWLGRRGRCGALKRGTPNPGEER
jgi:predicted O-methyltransferase YrrM